MALVITLVVSIPAGYALAKMQFRGRRVLLITTLVVMLMPTAALVLPTFLEINHAHLVNTPLSVVLPYSFFPFGVYLTYIYFSTAVPADLIAAAKIDGCGELSGRSSGSRCRWPRRSSRWSGSSASSATGTTSSCPT